MKILAIDTTSQQGGVGVFEDGESLALIANDRPANFFSVTLFEMADRALLAGGITMTEIDLFAVSNGPGSFTGIRVGIAAAQGWAKAFGRAVAGVSNLQAMVEATHPDADWAFPILDARRGEFYVGRFRRAGSAFTAADDGVVIKGAALAEFCGEVSPGEIASRAWIVRESDPAAAAWHDSLSSLGKWIVTSGTLLPAIAGIALRQQSQGQEHPLDELQPRYIRRPDAELNWRG